MHAINMYILTRLLEADLYSHYEKSLSLRNEKIKVRSEEIELIRAMVANFRLNKASFNITEGWFYSFTIPQIGKEFDLLKIDKKGIIVNVELKSQPVSLEKIERQLKQNRYYLSHMATTIYSFTYLSNGKGIINLYIYDGNLRKSSFRELIEKISEIDDPIIENVETRFRPRDYLISPLNTPKKFLGNCYYLSAQQEAVKKEIIVKSENTRSMWGIKGSAGTGKTLLLYDLAKTLSNRGSVCIVHCGMLSEGHEYINRHSDNITVIDAKSLSKDILNGYSVICVDETQRLYSTGLDRILSAFDSGTINTCIFSYDYSQVLSKTERRRNNPQRLNDIEGFEERKLANRIRSNIEVFSFIRNMLRLSDKAKKQMRYDNIDILYANNIKEADIISKLYIKRGYVFITFTPSQYVNSSIDHYSRHINSHQVMGQEFDKVVVVLDSNFIYGEDGALHGREHPNPDYLFPRLFYQNISRTREKLCIIVLNNLELFKNLLCIKENVQIEDMEQR